jgi:SAM-dependent methyltransferase
MKNLAIGKKPTLLEYSCSSCFTKYRISEGYYVCPNCHIESEIINGIPRFVDKSNYSGNFGFQWKKFSKTQLDSFVGHPLSEERVKEVMGQNLSVLAGKLLLEAGSGAGRFSEIFLKYEAKLYSFDYSEAIEANQENNGKNFTLFQGSIYEIPFSKQQFDAVFCLGVIQHTPNPKLSFKCLIEQVKPGGAVYIDVYEKRNYSFLNWKYMLRPITKHLPQPFLFNLVQGMVFVFLPLSQLFGKLLGRLGHKFFPVANFMKIPFKSYKERYTWSVLDTFDWYGPTFDNPKTLKEIKTWFEEENFQDVKVFRGSNGVIGRGSKAFKA